MHTCAQDQSRSASGETNTQEIDLVLGQNKLLASRGDPYTLVVVRGVSPIYKKKKKHRCPRTDFVLPNLVLVYQLTNVVHVNMKLSNVGVLDHCKSAYINGIH